MWEAAGGRVSYALAGRSAVAVLGDDPAATGAVSLGVARAHALTRRVFLLDLLGDGQGVTPPGHEESPGVSDMVHFGVSLAHAARPRPESPNLFVIPGGAESPLSQEILTSRWWGVVAEQARRADALLLVAVPSMVPGIESLVRRLDGVVLVGEAHSPLPQVRVLAEVRAAAAMRTPATPIRTVAPSPAPRAPAHPWRVPMALAAAGMLAVAMVVALVVGAPRWMERLGLGGGTPTQMVADTELPPIPPPTPSSAPAGSEAAYSVELLFTNSSQDALEYLLQSADSLPAATFSTVAVGAEAEPWYRLMAGAFPDSVAADAYLAELRRRGRLATGAGAIARTPFALLLDSASSEAVARVRVEAYRGRGIPAYVLRDAAQVWRVYAGAFPTEIEAQLHKQQLDSQNIQSALVMRAGSTP